MAIIIEPEQTIEKPNLVLSSENQFSKIVYQASQYRSISSNTVKFTNAYENNIVTSDDKLGIYSNYGVPCSSNINEIKIGYQTGSIINITLSSLNHTITVSSNHTNSSTGASILTSDNFEFNISYTSTEFSDIQTYTYNNKIFKYRILYANLKLNITKNNINDLTSLKCYYFPTVKYGVFTGGSSLTMTIDDPYSLQNKYALEGFMDILKKVSLERELLDGISVKIPIAIENAPLPSFIYNGVTIPTDSTWGSFSWVERYNITFIANQISTTDSNRDISYGDDTHYSLSMPNNPFINTNMRYGSEIFMENQANKILSRYSNGKHYGNLSIKIDKYYDSSSETNVIYDPSYIDKKYINVGETIRPYIYDINKNKIPLLRNNGNPVDFIVMSSRLVFNNGIMSVVLKIMEK